MPRGTKRLFSCIMAAMMYPAQSYNDVMWNRWHNPPARRWWHENCRLPVIRRDGWKCRECGRKRGPGVRLVIHHTSYTDPETGESIIGREDRYLGLLVCLCLRCHDRIHRRKSPWWSFWN